MRRLSSVLSGVLILAALVGCSKKDSGSGPVEPADVTTAEGAGGGAGTAVDLERPATVAVDIKPAGTANVPAGAAAQKGAFDAMVKLWQAGDKEAAVKQFVAMDWASTAIFAEGGPFGMSEAAFVKLSATKRSAVQEEAMNANKAVREISRYVVEEGKGLAAQGQTAAAKTRYDAVRHCADALAGENQLALTQMVGQALQKYAAAEAGG